jgi:hypothetical protein
LSFPLKALLLQVPKQRRLCYRQHNKKKSIVSNINH